MEPFNRAEVIITPDHVAIGDLVTQTIGRLVGVDFDVAEINILVRIVVVVIVSPAAGFPLGNRLLAAGRSGVARGGVAGDTTTTGFGG